MTASLCKGMLLGLLRDRGALAMTFVLPVAFFLVFATIFASATGEQLRIHVAFVDEVDSPASRRLIAALRADSALQEVRCTSQQQLREFVRLGTADAGVILRGSLTAVGKESPILVVADPSRAIALDLLAGRLQKSYVDAVPDVALARIVAIMTPTLLPLTAEQRAGFDMRLALMARALESRDPQAERPPDAFGTLVGTEVLSGANAAQKHIAYYAGAVAVLFVLFSSATGAITLLHERDSGVLDRLLMGPGGIGVLVRARFLFIAAQAFVQTLVIFGVAWIWYGVDLSGHALGWIGITVAVSIAAAGMTLALVSACGTARQAETLSNVTILIVSAIGGSMVPRFFMPDFLRTLGWMTPNTWALEAYAGLLFRDASVAELMLPVSLLLATGGIGLAIASRAVRRWVVI